MGSEHILELDEDNFDDHIKGSSAPILVDFWADWCSPCKVVAAALEQLATEMAGRASVAKVNVDDNGDLAHRFEITSIPTLLVFKAGKKVDQLVGAAPKSRIRRLLEKHLRA